MIDIQRLLFRVNAGRQGRIIKGLPFSSVLVKPLYYRPCLTTLPQN